MLHNTISHKRETATAFHSADRTEKTAPQSDCDDCHDRPIPTDEPMPKDFFVSEKWHEPYAKALMEAEPTRLSGLIVKAEHAIFNRCLELCANPGRIEYSRDLQNAINVLIQLKNAVGNPVNRSHSVSKTVFSHP